MSKIFTIDNIMISFVTALFYGVLDIVMGALGVPSLVSFGLSMVLGTMVEEAVDKVVFSKAVQQRPMNRVLTYVGFVLLFLVGQGLSMTLVKVDLVDYLVDGIQTTILFSVGGFVVTMIIRAFKSRKIREQYGDGKDGFMFELDGEDIEEVNRENQPITGAYDAEMAVKTRTGIFVGDEDGDCVSYLGIPYAKPPVGELRWKAPEPLPSSDAVFEAKNFGYSAVQVENTGAILKLHRQSEDALTLNVYVAGEKTQAKKPVIVMFHYGDFTFGGSADPLLYGDNFVSQYPDIVYVTINYRLGIFGFINFSGVPGGEDYPDAMNLGLLDQVAALRWVKENIAAFGGDPDRICVVGFEAGASCITLLAATEEARDLFQKAFVFFGGPEFAYRSPEKSKSVAEHLMEETHATTMDELMRLDTQTLKEAEQRSWCNMCAPTRDGVWIPTDVYGAYRDGVAAGIDFIFGISPSERRVVQSFLGEERFMRSVSLAVEDFEAEFDGDTYASLKNYVDEHADSSTEHEVYASLCEQWYILSMYRCAARLTEGGNTVRMMYWDEKPLIDSLGSGTVDVVATLLGNGEALELYGNVANDDLTESFQGFLAKFAMGKALNLYPNEIRGFDGIKWKKFPKALIVRDHTLTCDVIEDELTDVDFFRKYMSQ